MINERQRKQLRLIPAVHDVLQEPEIREIEAEEEISKVMLTLLCQESIQELREDILKGLSKEFHDISPHLIRSVREKVSSLVDSPLKPLINGTGVILHTNLGRAKLSKAAQAELAKVASFYSNLEFKLDEGVRGSRHSLVESLICQLTGAEAAVVCNNNAAAVFLTLREIARDQEVIVSRGELVEIGGSFRISEIMKESGAKLIEVGTTNKTHLYDYERNITEETGLIMKVHTSNFVISGFTATVSGVDLVQLAHQHQVPVFEDLGSGVLMDLRPYGIGQEPTVQEVIKEGVDIVSFSGDKLLGGPQAGIIAGKKKYIDRLKKNQLMRSLRVDKFTLAALHATLKSYLQPHKAVSEIPTLHMILQKSETVKYKAELFMSKLNSQNYTANLIEVESEVGGGTMPDVSIPSWAVELTSHCDQNVAAFSKRLRLAPFPVIGRIHNNRYILDFRTIDEDEINQLVASLEN